MAVVNRWPLLGVLFALIAAASLAVCLSASSARAATPQTWYWSKERAATVAYVSDQPRGCASAIFHSGSIGNCVLPDSGPDCVGVGPRTISSTDDVYLYKTFKCDFATKTWTPAALRLAHQQAAQHPYGIGGSGTWIDGAAVEGKGTLRVQVTGRFTADVTWLGKTWTKTIQPTG
jgi:hypothetical protein